MAKSLTVGTPCSSNVPLPRPRPLMRSLVSPPKRNGSLQHRTAKLTGFLVRRGGASELQSCAPTPSGRSTRPCSCRHRHRFYEALIGMAHRTCQSQNRNLGLANPPGRCPSRVYTSRSSSSATVAGLNQGSEACCSPAICGPYSQRCTAASALSMTGVWQNTGQSTEVVVFRNGGLSFGAVLSRRRTGAPRAYCFETEKRMFCCVTVPG